MASFDDFNWPSKLDEFSDINILLGWNGTGKTTLSRVLRTLETGSTDGVPEGGFTLEIDGSRISIDDDLSEFQDDIQVFNDDYIRDVLREDKNLPHIFYVSEEGVDFSELQEEVEEKRSELKKLDCGNDFKQIAKDRAEFIKEISGINSLPKELSDENKSYSSYDSRNFEKRIKQIDEAIGDGEVDDYKDYIVEPEIDQLKEKLSNIQRTKTITGFVKEGAEWLMENLKDINEILESSPYQKTSARIKKLGHEKREWVEDGVNIHFNEDNERDSCLFCGSKIKNKDELINHFSKEVVNLSQRTKDYLNKVQKRDIKLKDHKRDANTKQLEQIKEIREALQKITNSLKNKQKNISEKKDKITIDIEHLTEINIESSVDPSVAHKVEKHYVAEKYEDYKRKKEKYETCKKKEDNIKKKIKILENKLTKAKQKASDVHKPAERLNVLFQRAFPNKNIQIQNADSEVGYELVRDQEECEFESLSEGEQNFIALSYFILSLNDDKKGLSEKGVVVIDDPVSSLDSGSIFQVYSMLVNGMEENSGRQYFIFTHNLDFFGHLKECYLGDSNACFFHIASEKTGSIIKAIHPLLKKHKSDYYYIFSKLHDLKEEDNLENAYIVINLLRGWLETFLQFKFARTDNSGFGGLLKNGYEAAKKEDEHDQLPSSHEGMKRFLNHGSHGFPNTNRTDPAILMESTDKIKEAFKLVKILDPLHFKKLKRMVRRLHSNRNG